LTTEKQKVLTGLGVAIVCSGDQQLLSQGRH